jgi:hypothetical protein
MEFFKEVLSSFQVGSILLKCGNITNKSTWDSVVVVVVVVVALAVGSVIFFELSLCVFICFSGKKSQNNIKMGISKRTTRESVLRCMFCISVIIVLFLIAITIYAAFYFGLFKSSCPSVAGRTCNGVGTCFNGVCRCDNPFFSGADCTTTLAEGFSLNTGLACSGNGYVGATHATIADIPLECRETQPTVLNGFQKRGGWDTKECFQAIQTIMRRVTLGTFQVTDIFALPICQCYEQWSGPACAQIAPCPLGVTLDLCSGNGNTSVGFMDNITSTGVGCQCNNVNHHLSPSLLQTYSKDGIERIRKEFALTLSHSMCGDLYQHPFKSDLKLIWNRNPRHSFTCHCDEKHFGDACQFGWCPEDKDGNPCSTHGHPNFGFGAQMNTTQRLSLTKSYTICSSSSQNCYFKTGEDRCVRDLKLCDVSPYCSPSKPIRCRDGSCVKTPVAYQLVSTYSFGLYENYTSLINKKACYSSSFQSNSSYLTGEDYWIIFRDCGGSEVSLVPDTGMMLPGGDIFFDTSLLVVAVESPYPDGTLTLTYRGKVITVGGAGMLIAMFNETYEEEQIRLYFPTIANITVTPLSDTQIDLYPSPFVFDPSNFIPSEWQYIRLVSSKVTDTYVVVTSVRARMEFDPRGDWFIANQTLSQVLLPSGDLLSMEECVNNFRSCIWNWNTKLSFDGTKKLCGVKTISTDLECISSVPDGRFARLFTVLTATGTGLGTYDWTTLGPWHVGSSTFAMDDFSQDGDWLTITPSREFRGVNAMSYVELQDVIIPAACPPSFVNASVLNLKWLNQGSRRNHDFHAGEKVVAQYESYGQSRIVRGTVASSSLETNRTIISVKGYESQVVVTAARIITADEFNRGLPEESFRVFPAICSDGQASSLTAHRFNNVSVSCDCDLKMNRIATCTCKDEHSLTPYPCTCLGESCDCIGFGMTDLELQLAKYVREELTAVCFYSNTQLVPDGDSSHLGSLPTVYSTNGENVQFERPGWSAYLAEFRIYPCVPGVVVKARTSLFSDLDSVFQLESSCVGRNQTVRPVYPGGFEDLFDEWYISNLTAGTYVTPIFAPNGIPVRVNSVSVTSNQADKNNVLWNDLTFWLSEATDVKPTVTLLFTKPQHVTAVYFVLESAGIYLNENETIPVAIYVQATTDGSNWMTVGRLTSSVYHGKEDRWLPMDFPDTMWTAIRLRTHMTRLGIREFVPLTNQRCDQDNLQLIADHDFESITSEVINRILSMELTSESCFCVENCFLQSVGEVGARVVSSSSECVDEKWSIEGLGLPPLTWGKAEKIDSGYYYSLLVGFLNDTTTIISHVNESIPNLRVFWLSPNVTTLTVPLAIFNETTPFIPFTVLYENILYLYVYLNSSVEWVRIGEETPPQYQVYRNLTLVERGIACQTGNQCGKCGNSDRTLAKNPGVGCSLTDYEKTIYRDYQNRTDHVVMNSAPLDEYLDTGKVTARLTGIPFLRTTYTVASSPCLEGCGALLRCPNGDCVETLTQCSQTRYNNLGDGCVRRTTQEKKYRCVCDVGYGGQACSYTYCTPGDPYVGAIDPHKWCSCGPNPPLRELDEILQAPLDGCYLDEDILVVNRNGLPRRGPGDVGWNRISAEFAESGAAILRCYYENGRKVRTNCDYYVRGPFGQQLSLEDCVASRHPITGFVTDWKHFPTPEGPSVQFIWETETQYDDFPFRCPNTNGYHCVATEKDCYNAALIAPVCGVPGAKCRVDGTCDCPSGKTTFTYTKEWTDKALVPYDASNPTIWGTHTFVPFLDHCNARDCSNNACEIPYGCFPGTKEREFLDRHVACTEASGHGGKCGTDQKACQRGEVTEMVVCSGKGIPRQRDYRPEEWYCACGDLKTRLVSLADGGDAAARREITELKPNGFGGETCEFYYCQEDPRKLHYSRRDPISLQPYVDEESHILPGKWIGGSCQAPNGPNPDDIRLWQTCCPGLSRFDRCPKVLCSIARTPTCVLPEECTGSERKPLVYPCHNKGKPLADGTCECDTDPNTGTGWGPDSSGVGCFRKIACPVAANGIACNGGDTNPKSMVVIPKEPYFESQIWSFFLRAGLAISNEEMVRHLVGSVDGMDRLLLSALVQFALDVLSAMAGVASGICVYPPPDNSSLPFGMLPYADKESLIGPYGKAVKIPYDLTLEATMNPNLPILRDGKYRQYTPQFASIPFRANLDYYTLQANTGITFTFTKSTYVTHIRIYAKLAAAGLLTFQFFDGSGNQICSNLVVSNPDVTYYAWLSSDGSGAHSCQTVYRAYEFQKENPRGWVTNCMGVENQPSCFAWEKSDCLLQPGGVVQSLDSLETLDGCDVEAKCCVPVSGTTSYDSPTQVITIYTKNTVLIQEIVLFGRHETYVPVPPGLLNEIIYRQKGAVNPHHGGQCIHYPYIRAILNAEDSDYYQFSKNGVPEMNHNYETAKANCISSGGVLAEARGHENSNYYAKDFGDKCFANGNTVQDKKCIIEARNRWEIPQTPPLTTFIEQSCTYFGCFICPDGNGDQCSFLDPPRIDYYSTPDYNGAQFHDSALLGIREWSLLLNAGYREGQRQKKMRPVWDNTLDLKHGNGFYGYNPDTRDIPGNGIYRLGKEIAHSPVYYHPGDGCGCELPNNTPCHCTYTRWAYDPPSTHWTDQKLASMGYENLGIGLDTTWVRQQDAPEAGGLTRYWTNPKVCKIVLYGRLNCGQGSTSTDDMRYTDIPFNGPTKTYFVTPWDDYEALFRNMYNDTWDGCAGYSRSFPITCSGVGERISDEYPGCTLSQVDAGTCRSKWSVESISVTGPCYVVIQRKVTNDITAYNVNKRTTYVKYPYDDPTPNEFYDSSISPTVKHLIDSQFNWIPGCYDDIHVDTIWAANKYNTLYYSGPGNTLFVRTESTNHWQDLSNDDSVFTNRGHYRGFITSIVIYPAFASYNVEFNVRAEQVAHNGPDSNEFTMGWLTHPYMCTRVDFRVLKGFEKTPTYTSGSTWIPTVMQSTWKKVDTNKNWFPSDPFVYSGDGSLVNEQDMVNWNQGSMTSILSRFVSCKGFGLLVRPCPSCIIQQPPGNWEFDQRKYTQVNNQWTTTVTSLRQTTDSTNFPNPRPQLHFTWTEAASRNSHPYMKAELMRTLYPRAYARMLAFVRESDYKVLFWYDHCVAVMKNPTGGQNTYYLDTFVCEKSDPTHFALCQRDYLKHVIQSGRQCDICGPSSALGSFPSDSPKPTVFENFPLAVRANYPLQHAIKDAYLAGTLDDFVQQGVYDWDSIMSYLQTYVNESLVWGAPGFIDAFQEQLSTRPGYLSEGVTDADYNHWIDVALYTIWPVDCGVRCSKFSGICRRRRALDVKYCDPDAPQTPLTELPQDQYPLDLLPVLATDTYRYSRCSRLIDPGTYGVYDAYGGISVATKQFVILEHVPSDYVLLKLTRTGQSSWQNTGKSSHGYTFHNFSTIWGEFSCTNCVVTLWLSKNSITYTTTPADKLVLGNFTTSPYLVRLKDYIPSNGTYYKVLGFDIYGNKGDIIKLYRALASDPSTVAECQRANTRKMYEPSSSIDVDDNRNECPFVFDEQLGKEPGVCYCGDPSLGGRTCEAPAIIPSWKGEKVVCGGFGQPGYYAIDYFGDRVPVNEDGSWQSKSHPEIWGCATLNPGLIFRTRLFTETRYDWQFVYFTERQVGQQDYEQIPAITDETTGLALDLTSSTAQQTCASASTTLASWFSGDEANNFVRVANGTSTFVDLERTDDGNGDFRWGQREVVIASCQNGACGTVVSANPCLTSDPACTAVQYFNLVYGVTGNGLTDGTTEVTYTVTSSPLTLTLRRTVVSDGLFVKLWVVGTPTITVSTQTPAVVSCGLTGTYEFTCAGQNTITSIRIAVSPTPTTVIKEVGVWALKEQGSAWTAWY